MQGSHDNASRPLGSETHTSQPRTFQTRVSPGKAETADYTPASLACGARRVVASRSLDEKTHVAHATARAWFGRSLSLRLRTGSERMPDQPGRPDTPILLPPRDMPKRAVGGTSGRIALLHSIAHIELNAVDLTWDMVGRFADRQLPRSFFDDWVRVGLEEAKHFSLLRRRLEDLDSHYGALPAHHGLWEAAESTGDDLAGRLAVIPLVLEARGLDITPPMIEKARERGDPETAAILEIIYRDEKRHVAFGAKWFRYLCDKERCDPERRFQDLVRRHFKGGLKPPFNDRARSEAGLTPGFYRPLARLIG
ncbi:ferritin-like domain-containing protein [Stappia indica]|uniref:ferritin-like domain-containing protein n=1 Tax=Stappia indica TaxID=538381 RepID=UPI0009F3E424|nr:ferritin-like domain-containing protein [Stappia indica]